MILFPRRAGNELSLLVERGDMIVPSMNEAFPKKGEAVQAVDTKPKPYYQQVNSNFLFRYFTGQYFGREKNVN